MAEEVVPENLEIADELIAELRTESRAKHLKI